MTAWDLYCVDCQATDDFDSSNGERREPDIQRILFFRNELIALPREIHVAFDGYKVDLEFLAKHHGHELRAKSDYGAVKKSLDERLSQLEDRLDALEQIVGNGCR